MVFSKLKRLRRKKNARKKRNVRMLEIKIIEKRREEALKRIRKAIIDSANKLKSLIHSKGNKDYKEKRKRYYSLTRVNIELIKRDPSFIGNTYGYCLEYAPLDYAIVLITKAIWEAYKSVKRDEEVIYGPFLPDEIYLLPKEEAEFLVNEGYAKLFSKKEMEFILREIEDNGGG